MIRQEKNTGKKDEQQSNGVYELIIKVLRQETEVEDEPPFALSGLDSDIQQLIVNTCGGASNPSSPPNRIMAHGSVDEIQQKLQDVCKLQTKLSTSSQVTQIGDMQRAEDQPPIVELPLQTVGLEHRLPQLPNTDIANQRAVGTTSQSTVTKLRWIDETKRLMSGSKRRLTVLDTTGSDPSPKRNAPLAKDKYQFFKSLQYEDLDLEFMAENKENQTPQQAEGNCTPLLSPSENVYDPDDDIFAYLQFELSYSTSPKF